MISKHDREKRTLSRACKQEASEGEGEGVRFARTKPVLTVVARQHPSLALPDRPIHVHEDILSPIRNVDTLQVDQDLPRRRSSSHLPRLLTLRRQLPLLDACLEQFTRSVSSKNLFPQAELDFPLL